MTSTTQHGLASTYNNYACRCADCTEAWRVYQMAQRRKRGVQPRPAKFSTATHGAISTYKRGCRCDVCRERARVERAKYRARAAA